MFQGGRILVIAIILSSWTVTAAFAVGYQPVDEPVGVGGSKRVHGRNGGQSCISRIKQKCPVVLDETVAYVKDVLGQFGLVQKPGK
jgi:hypothetical protein